MRTDTGKAVRLSDYAPPAYLIGSVELDISLHPTQSIVTCTLQLQRNGQTPSSAPLKLDGDDLTILKVELDGKQLEPHQAAIQPDGLTLFSPPSDPFTLTVTTQVDPSGNTQLSGLYRSNGVYCTQCEAEGFRRITYFLDRPDVLSVYTTRIEADFAEAPILLGNGNPVETGKADASRHFAVWHDPHPKPSYLFAAIGGKLDCLQDKFTTASGKLVELGIYVEAGKAERAHYAMDALKRSMRWDETEYGREYDLAVFNIVAVSDFNMGAMENKGLNIFNDKYILASPATATDADYAGIETVVAHEYFHNWTGNRITCRDWFQLCLKEGLTVFRDQEFSGDQRSRAVRRIQDVRALRAAQFSEDAGPLAHNVRPDVYHEINNFYTATVYQKGAEVIRMLKVLIGEEAFRAGMDIYFERFDGTAAIVENFISCFEESSGKSLDQFMRWYSQSGTPEIAVRSEYDATRQTCTLHFKQVLRPTPGQKTKQPYVIPIRMGLINQQGEPITLNSEMLTSDAYGNGLLELSEAELSLTLRDISEPPVASLLRDFSAPVLLDFVASDDDLLTLIKYDTDPFNRWQAAQDFAMQTILSSVNAPSAGDETEQFEPFFAAMGFILNDYDEDKEFTAQALSLPAENEIARKIGKNVDPEAVHQAREAVKKGLASSHYQMFLKIYQQTDEQASYQLDAESAGRRAIHNTSLAYLAAAMPADGAQLASEQFSSSKNMTNRLAALAVLSLIDTDARNDAFNHFYLEFENDQLVVDKWFALQAMIPDLQSLQRVQDLTRHPAFSMNNPNRLRSLIASFAFGNPRGFNSADGSGFDFVADAIMQLDARNPQIAARLLTAFRNWANLEDTRKSKARSALDTIKRQDELSPDVSDIVTRMLA